MNWRDYLLDRLPLLLAFALALLFLLLVIQLGFSPLAAGDTGYILLLAGIFTGLILGIDHARQRKFYRALQARLDSRDYSPLPPGKTREQELYRQVLQQAERRGSDELRSYRKQATEHRTFTDLWVHQMKTPLAVLELTAQQAQDDSGVWNSVTEELERLSHGLDLMLVTARLERFDLDLYPAMIDLAVLTKSVVNDLKRSWLRAGVYPRIAAPAVAVCVETDAKWLDVVLRQLLTNAIKYSSAGQEVLISITGDADTVILSVKDHGIGIPPEDEERIFERFFTGANGRVGQESTGMGLYLAAQICSRLGHTLHVTSVYGQGSTLCVTFRSRSLHRMER